MPRAWKCRLCGEIFAHDPEGACPKCGRFCRRESVFVGEDELDGAEYGSIEDGEPISAGDLVKLVNKGRTETGLKGLDHIFGGGLPEIGTILLSAPAGVGKSTLLVVTFRELAKLGVPSLYISAEQNLERWGAQFSWLGKLPQKLMVHHEQSLDAIVDSIEKSRAKVFCVDSAHDVRNITDDAGFDLAVGAPTAVTHVSRRLREVADTKHVLIFVIGHVNNDGTLAGGSGIRHSVDAVLVMRQWYGLTERQKETDPRRVLRFEGKTRLGPRGRQALFLMRDDGLVDAGPLDEAEEARVEETSP